MYRRSCPVHVALLRIRTHQLVEVSRLELVGIAGKGLEIADPVIARSGGEDAGVKGERRKSGTAARAPAANRQSVRIRESASGQKLRSRYHVRNIDDPPLTIESSAVLPPKPRASAVVNVGDRKSAGR